MSGYGFREAEHRSFPAVVGGAIEKIQSAAVTACDERFGARVVYFMALQFECLLPECLVFRNDVLATAASTAQVLPPVGFCLTDLQAKRLQHFAGLLENPAVPAKPAGVVIGHRGQ